MKVSFASGIVAVLVLNSLLHASETTGPGTGTVQVLCAARNAAASQPAAERTYRLEMTQTQDGRLLATVRCLFRLAQAEPVARPAVPPGALESMEDFSAPRLRISVTDHFAEKPDGARM